MAVTEFDDDGYPVLPGTDNHRVSVGDTQIASG